MLEKVTLNVALVEDDTLEESDNDTHVVGLRDPLGDALGETDTDPDRVTDTELLSDDEAHPDNVADTDLEALLLWLADRHSVGVGDWLSLALTEADALDASLELAEALPH